MVGIHGIGHGILKLTNGDWRLGIAICDISPDFEFKYSCASGVYMDTKENSERLPTFTPCDVSVFPAVCFRYKTLYREFSSKENYCATQNDKYHVMGCVWGYAYQAARADRYRTVCAPWIPPQYAPKDGYEAMLHAACIDGIFSGTEMQLITKGERELLCTDLEDYPISKEICDLRKFSENFNHFTFEGDSFYYNTKILEAFRTGDGTSEPVPFLSREERYSTL